MTPTNVIGICKYVKQSLVKTIDIIETTKYIKGQIHERTFSMQFKKVSPAINQKKDENDTIGILT